MSKKQHHCVQIVFLSLVTYLFFLFLAGGVDARPVDPVEDPFKIHVAASGQSGVGSGIRVRFWWSWDTPEWTHADIIRCDGFHSDPQPAASKPIYCLFNGSVVRGHDNTYYDTGAEPGKYYWYKVKVCDDNHCAESIRSSYDLDNGDSSHIDGAWIGSMPAQPKVPKNIKVLTASNYSANISWTGMDPRMTDFFQVYWCPDTGTASCKHVPWYDEYHQEWKDYNFNEFSASVSMTAAHLSYWRVKACAQGIKDDDSTIVCSPLSEYGRAPSTEPPGTPKYLSASDGKYIDAIEITWAPSLGADYYELVRDNHFYTEVHGANSWFDMAGSGLKPGKKYCYFVTACNENGCSDPSNTDCGYMKKKSAAGTGINLLLLLKKGDK